jgi:hypothetical protein
LCCARAGSGCRGRRGVCQFVGVGQPADGDVVNPWLLPSEEQLSSKRIERYPRGRPFGPWPIIRIVGLDPRPDGSWQKFDFLAVMLSELSAWRRGSAAVCRASVASARQCSAIAGLRSRACSVRLVRQAFLELGESLSGRSQYESQLVGHPNGAVHVRHKRASYPADRHSNQ